MPIYEYTCQKCKAHVEVMQKVTDKPLTRHAKCGGKLEKEWSATSFQFKGSGWYVTDYAGKKAAKETAEAKDGGETKDAAAASEAKPDAAATEKPASAPTAKSKEKKPKASAASAGD